VITNLNLATHPFRNRLLPYVLAAGMLLVSLLGGVYCLAKLNSNRRENAEYVARIKEHQTEIDRLKGEGEKVQQALTPDQKALLTAAHKLVANKTFGWSRLFADLEGVLPSSVAASRIAVENVYQDGDRVKASLDFAVIARDFPSVQAMLQNMENSGLFRAELRGQDLQKNERMTFTEYTFHVIYTPAYGYTPAPTADVAQNQGGMQ
jgi:Tfp pilus assembly protein PilN